MERNVFWMTEKQNVTAASKLLRELQSALATVSPSSVRGDAEHALAQLWNTHVEALNADRHQGWTNRETWAAHLWISNRVGFRDEVCARMKRVPGFANEAEAIRRWMEERAETLKGRPHPETVSMLLEIGSLWRVNWDEIAEALKGDQP